VLHSFSTELVRIQFRDSGCGCGQFVHKQKIGGKFSGLLSCGLSFLVQTEGSNPPRRWQAVLTSNVNGKATLLQSMKKNCGRRAAGGGAGCDSRQSHAQQNGATAALTACFGGIVVSPPNGSSRCGEKQRPARGCVRCGASSRAQCSFQGGEP